jgi:hypothetical protein
VTAGAVTIIQGIKPKTLGKTYRLNAEGKLDKTTAGELIEGRFNVESFSTIAEFLALLEGIGNGSALCASLPTNGAVEGRIVTTAALKDNPGALTRTKKDFRFSTGPGVLAFDYDAPSNGQALTQDELWGLPCDVCPSIRDAGVLWWSSGSSFICNGDVEVQGLRGQRLYVLITDASDTERFCDVIAKKLWLSGHGYIAVSSSGARLVRGVFDDAMAQPARLDFAGGALCHPPLVQRRGAPVVLSDGGFLDTRAALPDLSADDEARYIALIEAAKAAKESEAQTAREAWKAARHGTEVMRLVNAGVVPVQAHERATRTLESALSGVLMGDFMLTLADGSTVSVGEAMDDPERWHGIELKDPLEPEFQNRKTCAKLYLFGAVPTVHSFARGGRTFKLKRQPARVYLSKGRKAELASELLGVLEREPDVFTRGRDIALVNGGEVRTLDRHALAHLVGTRIAAFTHGRDNDIPADIPGDVIEMLLSVSDTMSTKEIKALALLPYARPDGSIVDRPGYDARTGVYAHFDADDLPPVPMAPTADEVIDALRNMWGPWEAYDFATDEDRGAMLSAIVAAVCRPALDLCPGYFFDAPVQASGKTRAAGALGALIRNQRGGITPFVGGNGAEAEMSKKIVSMLRAGEGFVCIDNIVGRWSSPVLASLITDGAVNERVLGSNTWYKGDARIFVTATGNQAQPDTDLGRRFIRVRIDPRCERPQARDFSFDPVERALRERTAIAWGVLVLIRAHRAAGGAANGKGGAGFEQWSGLVRQAVLWAGGMGYTEAADIGAVGDPAASIMEGASVADPDVEAWGQFLRGAWESFGGAAFQARDVQKIYVSGALDDGSVMVREGLCELLGSRDEMTAKRVGRALKNRQDRIVGGLVLRGGGQDRTGTAFWKVMHAR